MHNILLGVLFLFSFITVTGQVSYSPDPVEVSADPKETENIQVDFELKNEGADTVQLAWTLEVEDKPAEWQYYVCDTEICYNFGQDVSSVERPNIILPGQSIVVMFHTLPAEVAGVGKYKINFFDVSEPDSILTQVPITVNTVSTSNKNISTKGLNLFPNPTTEFFRINTGDVVDKIDILNVAGQKAISFVAEQGKYYNIKNLDAGVYYVRLLDRNSDIVKVMRLKKL